MKGATVVTIDTAGRLVVPKPLRAKAGLRAGMALHIWYENGRLEIEPAPRSVQFEQKGSLLVALPTETTEALTEEAVAATLQSVRHRHDEG